MPVMRAAETNVMTDRREQYLMTLRADGCRLIASADNGNLKVNATVELEDTVIAEGVCTVTAVEFRDSLIAFKPDDVVTISSAIDSKGHQEVTLRSDRSDEWCSLPDYGSRVRITPSENDHALPPFEFHMQDFLNLLQVHNAGGRNRRRPEYRRWMLRVRHNHVRAAAGDGMRYFIFEKQGTHLIDVSDPCELFLDRDESLSIEKYLPLSGANTCALSRLTNGSIMIVAGHTESTTRSPQPDGPWPDEGMFLDQHSNLRFTLALDELRPLVTLLQSTADRSQKFPSVSMMFDLKQRAVRIDSKGRVRVQRTLPVRDMVIRPSSTVPDLVLCQVRHLKDLVSFSADTDRFIQLELMTGRKPVLVGRYGATQDVSDDLWERDTVTQTRTRRVIFFGLKYSPDHPSHKETHEQPNH